MTLRVLVALRREARTIAEQMSDCVAQRMLMGIAEGYLELAEHAGAVPGSPKS